MDLVQWKFGAAKHMGAIQRLCNYNHDLEQSYYASSPPNLKVGKGANLITLVPTLQTIMPKRKEKARKRRKMSATEAGWHGGSGRYGKETRNTGDGKYILVKGQVLDHCMPET